MEELNCVGLLKIGSGGMHPSTRSHLLVMFT